MKRPNAAALAALMSITDPRMRAFAEAHMPERFKRSDAEVSRRMLEAQKKRERKAAKRLKSV